MFQLVLMCALLFFAACAKKREATLPGSSPTGDDPSDPTLIVPAVSIVNPSMTTYLNGGDTDPISFEGTCTDIGEEEIIQYQVRDLVPVELPCKSEVFSFEVLASDLVEGSNTVRVYIVDNLTDEGSAQSTLILDTVVPTLSIDSLDPVFTSNVSSYVVAGSCSEEGNVAIDVGGVVRSTSCSGGTYSANLNLTSVADGGSISVLANMAHVAGNEAVQATSSVL